MSCETVSRLRFIAKPRARLYASNIRVFRLSKNILLSMMGTWLDETSNFPLVGEIISRLWRIDKDLRYNREFIVLEVSKGRARRSRLDTAMTSLIVARLRRSNGS